MTNTSHCEDLYKVQLTNITARLAATGSKLLFVTTTPYMPHRQQGDTVVEDMNAIARKVMSTFKIPVFDLYKVVTDCCGVVYSDCDICKAHPCSYHYNPKGIKLQSIQLAAAIRKALKLK